MLWQCLGSLDMCTVYTNKATFDHLQLRPFTVRLSELCSFLPNLIC